MFKNPLDAVAAALEIWDPVEAGPFGIYVREKSIVVLRKCEAEKSDLRILNITIADRAKGFTISQWNLIETRLRIAKREGVL